MYQHLPTADGSSLQSAPVRKYRDRLFVLLYLVDVILVCYFAFGQGVKSLSNDHETLDTTNKNDYKNFLLCLVTLSMFAGLFSFIWVHVLIRFAKQLITFLLWVVILLNFGTAIACFSIGEIAGGVVFLIFTILAFIYWRIVRERIEFASQILHVACEGVQHHLSIFFVVFLMLIISFSWLVIWSIALLGAVNEESDNDSNSDAEVFGYFGLLFSLYWGLQIFKYVVHCTVSGAISSWWARPYEPNAVSSAFIASITTSFGSVCFGSLFVAILETLKEMLKLTKKHENALTCCLSCIVNCLESSFEYFNRWAFCYVAIYGESFCSSGKKVMELFRSRGYTAIINDNLIHNALLLGSIVVGGLTCTVGLFLHEFDQDIFGSLEDAKFIIAFFAFFIGILICSLVMSVVSSAVATVFVCWAEDSQSFNQNHPDLFNSLSNAWNKMNFTADTV